MAEKQQGKLSAPQMYAQKKGPVAATQKKRRLVKIRPETADSIIRKIESGFWVTKALKLHKLHPHIWCDWLDQSDELSARYARARELMCDAMAQQIQDEVAKSLPQNKLGNIDAGMVQLMRLRVDTKKWLLSKVSPRYANNAAEVIADAMKSQSLVANQPQVLVYAPQPSPDTVPAEFVEIATQQSKEISNGTDL